MFGPGVSTMPSETRAKPSREVRWGIWGLVGGRCMLSSAHRNLTQFRKVHAFWWNISQHASRAVVIARLDRATQYSLTEFMKRRARSEVAAYKSAINGDRSGILDRPVKAGRRQSGLNAPRPNYPLPSHRHAAAARARRPGKARPA